MATRRTSEQPKGERPIPARLDDSSPWLPPPYELADVMAAKAVSAGTASAEQQQRFTRWVVNAAAATYDLAYRPGGENGRRDTDFALGRAFVGQQVVKLINLNPAYVKRERDAGPSEQT